MDQTRYDVLESAFEVVAGLSLPEYLHPQRGAQFQMNLMVQTSNGVTPFTIWIDRFKNGTMESHVVHESVDESRVVAATASLVPSGERFNIEICVERARDHSANRPYVRLSPKFFRLLRASASAYDAETVERFLRSFDHS